MAGGSTNRRGLLFDSSLPPPFCGVCLGNLLPGVDSG